MRLLILSLLTTAILQSCSSTTVKHGDIISCDTVVTGSSISKTQTPSGDILLVVDTLVITTVKVK